MIRYTTPTHTHIVDDVDLTGCDVYVSYKQGSREAHFPADEVVLEDGNSKITVDLSQKQTGGFKAGKVSVQINWIYPDGRRDAVASKTIEVLDNLLAKVVYYEGN